MCGVDGRSLAVEALRAFAPRKDHGPHTPQVGLITCKDARITAGGHYNDVLGDYALRETQFAALFPSWERASWAHKAIVSFHKLKAVDCVKVEGHSFCGAATAAYDCPNPENAANEDIYCILKAIEDSGADIPRLVDAFKIAAQGNDARAINLLSRHMVLHSLTNLMEYPGVRQRMDMGEFAFLPIYHVLKQDDPDQYSYLEVFDLKNGQWKRINKETPDGDFGFLYINSDQESAGYRDIVRQSIEWGVHVFEDGTRIELPRHASSLIDQYPSLYGHHRHLG